MQTTAGRSRRSASRRAGGRRRRDPRRATAPGRRHPRATAQPTRRSARTPCSPAAGTAPRRAVRARRPPPRAASSAAMSISASDGQVRVPPAPSARCLSTRRRPPESARKTSIVDAKRLPRRSCTSSGGAAGPEDRLELCRRQVGDQTAASTVDSCTSAASRDSASGSVPGSTPCPRLKMWPGPAAGAGEHVTRRRLDALPRPEQHRRVEIPLDAVPGADDRPAVVEARSASRARSRPRPSAPAPAAGSRRPCRSGSSARRQRRECGPTTVRRTPRSRPATARRPRNRRAGRRRRLRAPARRGTSAKQSASFSISACQTTGSAYISALTRANSRDGLPSTR